ncbi:4Fe-4S binding protein [candidate division WOR-3 bacterium]|nr:4Fe-4S binding protein [candidate division WOR-3 bacterium]
MHKTNDPEPTFHYVCTRAQAVEKINEHDRFFVSNCGCREGNEEGCKRSRVDVCLFFDDKEMTGTGTGWKEVDRAFVDGILKEAQEKRLVYRPFHYAKDRTHDQGVCFCCDDCCAYFHGDEWGCDPSDYIEKTDMDSCTNCGECEAVCYFGARKMVEGQLKVNCEKCAGCALCIDMCPENCIRMVERS